LSGSTQELQVPTVVPTQVELPQPQVVVHGMLDSQPISQTQRFALHVCG
jgi:hypothetical protein